MLGDEKHIGNILEAMKMTQATLQQIMTLSAGGLALFFTFMSKATFVSTIELLGISVVLSWVVSLSTAAYAHKLHANLFLSVARLNSVQKQLDALESLSDEVDSELKTNPNKLGVIERAKAKIDSERNWANSEFRGFEKSFFPNQVKAQLLINISLFMLVLGFVMLSIGYVFCYAT